MSNEFIRAKIQVVEELLEEPKKLHAEYLKTERLELKIKELKKQLK